MYPLKFKQIFKDYVWGGRNLERYGKNLPSGKVAESWELSCHKDGTSIISNGEYIGFPLDELVLKKGVDIIGDKISKEYLKKFPLLVKLIDANSNLSVQVHPNDEYAFINENGEFGKNEMWYIVEAKKGSTLVSGIKSGITKEIFTDSIKEGKVIECLSYVPIEAGDVINIPAGHIHAIGKGSIIIEIQQNSNTTYRVYDYDRVDINGEKRELHIEKALDVIDFSNTEEKQKYDGLVIDRDEYTLVYLAGTKYFAAEKIILNGEIKLDTLGERFHILTCYKGKGSIQYNVGKVEIGKGETILIPAILGEYFIEGNLEIIKSYVPNIKTNILEPLKEEGYSIEEIEKNIGGIKYA